MLEPGSVQDIARVIRFANKHDLRVAVRGHGHSIYGQSLVQGGIVIAMSSLAEARNLPGARVLADAGCSWGMVLQETLKEGATPAVFPYTTLFRSRHSRLSGAQRRRDFVDRRHQPDYL